MTPAKATYTPQPDITAYELARCLAMAFDSLSFTIIDKEQYDAMDEDLKRHFTITELYQTPVVPEG